MVDIGGRAGRRRDQRRQRIVRWGIAAGAVAVVAVIAVVFVVVTAEDDPKTSSAASTRRTTTTSTAPTTTLPATTTTFPATPVPRSSNPIVALAQQYDGFYTGTWTNTTKGTSGPATLEIRIDPTANTLFAATQLGGDALGGGTDFGRVEATINVGDPNAPVTTQTERLGVVTARLDQTFSLVLEAADVPDGKVASFTLTGSLRADRRGFDATYTVTFEDRTAAQGTVTVACAPEGQRPNEVTTLCSL